MFAMRFALFFLFIASLSACPFCNPAILEKQGVYIDDELSILYCLTPATLGNLLVVPKRHMERFEQLTEKEMAAVQKAIQKIASVLPQAYGISEYVIIQKNGIQAGQSVLHSHFHVIPAPIPFVDLIDTAFHYRPRISDEEMKRRVEELKPYFTN